MFLKPTQWIAVILALSISAAPVVAQPAEAAPMPVDKSGDQMLAARFEAMALSRARGQVVVPPLMRQAVALLQAAHRLDPAEPRYALLLAYAAYQVRDEAVAMDALRAYRAIAPNDETAAVKAIRLYADQMESADERLNYLLGILSRETIAPVVRSETAVMASRLQFDRLQKAEGIRLIDQALTLNPRNSRAILLRLQSLPADASPADRAAVLVSLLEANPNQPEAMLALAQLCTRVGLVKESLGWYQQAVQLTNLAGGQIARETGHDLAGTLLLAGQLPESEGWAAQMTSIDPNDSTAWFIRLVAARSANQPEAFQKISGMAHIALVNRLAAIRERLGAEQTAPIPLDGIPPAEPPKLEGDVERFTKSDQDDVKSAYFSALAELCWYYLYFKEDAAMAQPVAAGLRAILKEGDPLNARLDGWVLLVSGRSNEARVKLSAIADRDPLALLGLLKRAETDPANRNELINQGARMMQADPTGLGGIMLWERLRAAGVTLTVSEEGQKVKQAIDRFPLELLDIHREPRKFYLMRGEPLLVGNPFGAPLMVRVFIRNVSRYDLTVGEDGIINDTFLLDAQLRGVANQSMPGIAVGRFTQKLVLRPNDEMVATVRLDQGALAQYLLQQPQISVPISVTAISNPQSNGVEGIAGYRAPFVKLLERTGVPLEPGVPANIKRVQNVLANGSAGEKLRYLELCGAHAERSLTQARQILADNPNNEEASQQAKALQQFANELLNLINSAEAQDASVRTYAGYLIGLLSEPKVRLSLIDQMAQRSEFQSRIMAISLAEAFPLDVRNAIFSQFVEKDSDATVKMFAQGGLDLAQYATTQPAGGATTRPAN